ncbi:MAG: hypothetical protein H3Z54_03550 [archaeon]|nr:hypothetical protein [archaeon]
MIFKDRMLKSFSIGLELMVSRKEYKVPDIQPVSFVIEILDNEQKAVEGVTFNVTVDNGNTMAKQTDKEGIIEVPKAKNEIKLSLPA